jgi:sulfur-oxidizing protein SoxY
MRLIPRRRFVTAMGGLALGLAGGGLLARPRAQGVPAWQRLDAARELLGGAEPQPGRLALDLPLLSEDGASVPLGLEAEPASDPAEQITSFHLFALSNPSPEIAVVTFGPAAGRPAIATRVRLDGTQTVLALARTAGGDWLAAEHEIRITTSGCLVRDDTYASEGEMETRVRAPERIAPGEPAEVLTLINHPMETGLRTDATGAVIPERIVHSFRAEAAGDLVLEVRLFRSLSANPYFRFFVAPEHPGELAFTWEADDGRIAEASAAYQLA